MEDASTRTPARARGSRLALKPRDGWFFAIAAGLVVLDQLTKWFIRQAIERGDTWPSREWPLRLVHLTNSGAAFGMLQDAGPMLALTSLIGVVAVAVYLLNPGFAHPLMRVGLAAMLGGATGNLIDRVINGEVVDFIKVPHFPAFNVADSSITIGVLLLLWAMTKEPEAKPAAN
jgi:signal peptidase II